MSLLASDEMSVGALAGRFRVTRPAVAKHLRVLRDAGLITTSRKGRETLNQLNPDALKPVADWLGFFCNFWDEKLDALQSAVEESDG